MNIDFDTVDRLTKTSYGGIPPYTKGSDTSKAAALMMLPNVGTIRYRILELFMESGEHGLIDRDIENILNVRPSSCRTRRKELEMGGFVKRTERTRATDSGRQAHVYVLADEIFLG